MESGDDKSLRGVSNCHTLHERLTSFGTAVLISCGFSVTPYISSANGECMIRWPVGGVRCHPARTNSSPFSRRGVTHNYCHTRLLSPTMLVSPSSSETENSISKKVVSCMPAFKLLLAVAEASEQQNHSLGQISSEWVKDKFDRFKLWSQNIGAHRTGRSSLDYRLRDASNLRKQAIDLVGDLAQTLEDGKYLTT